MTLLIEFLDERIGLREIDEMQRIGDITLRERAEIQPNGNPAFFLKWWELPAYKLQLPVMPDDAKIRYTYRYGMRDGHAAREGIYEIEGIEMMSVQHGLDTRDGAKISRVMIASGDLAKICQVYEDLRANKLRPTQEWSSSGSIEAPKEPKGEGSGQHTLPPKAATAPRAA
jgi:hypothetical protein